MPRDGRAMTNAFYVNGAWRMPGSDVVIEIRNPATEEVIHRMPVAAPDDVDAAVEAARTAFDSGPWRTTTGAERAAILRRIADGIAARTRELAAIEVRDNGKPMPEAIWDIEDAAGCFAYYADLAEGLDGEGEAIALSHPDFRSRVVREPVGVAALVIPWNFPLLMAAWKVAPALAAGCTVVLKPSELTPLSALELPGLMEDAGVPPGVFNLVMGDGRTGAALTAHPGVDKIAFTGSVPTGRKVMQAAAEDIKTVSLELGGKSPFVVFADSDIDDAVEWIMFGIFWNQGEVCSATSRVLVERPIFDRLLSRLVEEAARIPIGPGDREGVLLGALASEGQYRKVLAAIDKGVADGARLMCGGRRPDGIDRGYFVEPTVFVDAPLDSDLWREETFGPVVCVHPFDTEEEAIRLANDSVYGLGAAVMSADTERADRVARAFRAGIVWVNCSQPTFTEAPWGGYRQSGIGRELGRWGLENYLETKQITRWTKSAPWGWYLKADRP